MEDRVDLGDQLDAYVDGLVEDGRFASRDDVLREGVRALQAREQAQLLAALDASIERGIADAEAGKARNINEVAERLRKKYEAIAVAQGK